MKKFYEISYNNTMEKLLFGTAGIPISTKKKTTEAGIERIYKLKLDSMEIEFVKGVKMSKEKAKIVKETAEKFNVKLTVHAPYWINLNSSDKKILKNSKKHIIDSAIIGSICGAKDICFHPAYYHDEEPKKVYEKVKKEIISIRKEIEKLKIDVILRPETMGKPTQFGSLEELLSLSQEIEGVEPTIDFAHLYARSLGEINNYEKFCEILEKYKKYLGEKALERMQIHISGMKYGEKGEIEHLTFKRSKFNYKDCIKALKDYKVKGFLICESPTLEKDAILIKKLYESL
ncbi:MAG: TIM barrel protein [candidate division WOR-3 bacterium]